MNNKENKIDILKEIIKENEELKEQNKKIETKNEWLKKNIEDINNDWIKDHNKQYTEIETLKAQIQEMQQQQKAYTTPIESIEQLEYIEKALNKNKKIDMKFIRSSISMLLKAMKYNKLCESHKTA